MDTPVRSLRARWKPIKQGPAADPAHEAVRVRLHRCWSWMQRIELLQDPGADDARIIYGWIALNSLYGRWDETAREPVSDKLALDTFLRRLFHHDRDQRIASLLTEQRQLVKDIAGDEYLSRHFWMAPGETEARRTHGHARKLAAWYVEGNFPRVLDLTLQRLYLARCQLVHGAATCGSQLNRTAVARCARFLTLFLPEASIIVIDHAWTEDWSGLCYPPIQTG